MKSITVGILCLLVLASCMFAGGDPKSKQYKTLNANAWQIYVSNYGHFVFPRNSSAGASWNGPVYTYIYSAGLWVGALDTLDSARVSWGNDMANGGSEYCPANPHTWDWANYTTDTLCRVFLSTNATDLADWPLRDAGNSPIVLSNQDSYTTFSDENPAFTGGTNVGIRVRQSSYAWNTGFNNNVVYYRYTLINATSDSLRAVYAGLGVDADIGDESGTNANDLADFDYTRSLGIQYQNATESGWPNGGRTGQLGLRLLQTPANNTGAVVHVVDDSCAHDIPVGNPLGMTAFKIWSIAIAPTTDADRYAEMRGINYNTHVADAYDVDNYGPSDKRFMMTTGPFNLAAGDSVTIALAVMAAFGRDTLLRLADSAAAFYARTLGVAHTPTQRVELPGSLQLNNRPNPVLSSTLIEYQLPAAGNVQAAVYNIAGQLVKTLVNAYQSAGPHSARWNGDNEQGRKVSAGAYVCHVVSGKADIAKRMVVIK